MSICFFTITRLETGQIPGINKVFERKSLTRTSCLFAESSACKSEVSPFIRLARVVQKVDNAIRRINYYPVYSVVCFVIHWITIIKS